MAGIRSDPIKESLNKRVKAGGFDRTDPNDDNVPIQAVFSLKLKCN